MGKIFIKPAPGRIVRDPENKTQIPEIGVEVEENTFWRRRLQTGDVTKINPEGVPAGKPKKKED